MRIGRIYYKDTYAGDVVEDDDGYSFKYNDEYMHSGSPEAISATLPLQQQEFRTSTLHPFFDGLIPEGWLLDVSVRNWKLQPYDRMGLLLTCCRDCIGAVSVDPIEEAEE